MAVGKRCKELDDTVQKANVILVDIEGTTTSISFVKDKLFPYVRDNLETYVKENWSNADFQKDVELLRKQAKDDEAAKIEGTILIPESEEDAKEALIKNVLWQMDGDRKTTALKQLQGHIWQNAYKKGEIKGHIFSDVAPALRSWTKNGRRVYVYSSGSVEAQKLLFSHTEEGDLLELFSGHFDTEIGPKVDTSSYSKILEKLDCKAEEVVFLTDTVAEATAAEKAGINAVLVVRDGNTPLSEEEKKNFPMVTSFHDFVFESSFKRRRLSDEDIETSAVNGPPAEAPVSEDVEMKELDDTTTTVPESSKVSSTEENSSVNSGVTGSEDMVTDKTSTNEETNVVDKQEKDQHSKCAGEEKSDEISCDKKNSEEAIQMETESENSKPITENKDTKQVTVEAKSEIKESLPNEHSAEEKTEKMESSEKTEKGNLKEKTEHNKTDLPTEVKTDNTATTVSTEVTAEQSSEEKTEQISAEHSSDEKTENSSTNLPTEKTEQTVTNMSTDEKTEQPATKLSTDEKTEQAKALPNAEKTEVTEETGEKEVEEAAQSQSSDTIKQTEEKSEAAIKSEEKTEGTAVATSAEEISEEKEGLLSVEEKNEPVCEDKTEKSVQDTDTKAANIKSPTDPKPETIEPVKNGINDDQKLEEISVDKKTDEKKSTEEKADNSITVKDDKIEGADKPTEQNTDLKPGDQEVKPLSTDPEKEKGDKTDAKSEVNGELVHVKENGSLNIKENGNVEKCGEKSTDIKVKSVALESENKEETPMETS